MSIFKRPDGHGHTISYADCDGYLTCTFGHPPDETASRVRGLPNFKCRKDDVFICAPAKSGTHWTWEIASMMYNGNAETINKSKIAHMIEATPEETLEALPSPRILNTHVNIRYMPKEAFDKGCRIICVLRNPKDLVTSLHKHVSGIQLYEYKGEWEHFLPLFLQGKTEYNSWFDYVLEWEELMASKPQLPIHLAYFEDLKENPLQEVYRLGQFLGIENKDGLFEAISEKCDFRQMVKDKEPYLAPKGAFLGEGFSFFRKGEIGDWKNRFTVAQSEMFDKIYNEKMKNSKHNFRYSYQA